MNEQPDKTEKPDVRSLKITGPGIGLKLSLSLVTLLVILFLSISFLFILDQKNILKETMEKSGISLAKAIAINSENALISNDYWFLNAMTKEMISNRNILMVAVIKRDGSILAYSSRDNAVSLVETVSTDPVILNWKDDENDYNLRTTTCYSRDCLLITIPIAARGTRWGFIQIGYSLQQLHASIDRAYYNTITLAVLFLTLGTISVLLLSRRITIPLLELTESAQEIGAGNLDLQIDIHRTDELGLLATTFNQMARDLKKSQEKLEQTKKLERELEIAYQIQQSLLPRAMPSANGFDIAAFCKPAHVVGGDFYDFIPLAKDRLGIVIGDVSGKSIQSALYMAITLSLLRSHADRESSSSASPRDVLIATNRHLANALGKNAFVTLFYLILDRENGILTYSSAGHNPMVHVKTRQRDITLIKSRGYPLGLEARVFEERLEEKTLQIEEGDLLILFTDGIFEAMNARGQEFSLERFIELIRTKFLDSSASPDSLNSSVLQEVQAFSKGTVQHDDITIVTMRRNHHLSLPN